MTRINPIDLHTHSTCSDGSLTPSELVAYAVEKKLAAIALTDHDCVDGIEEALTAASDFHQKGVEIELVPGVELSTDYQGQDVHIVGLFIDYHNSDFRQYLKDFIDSRLIRNQKMCKKIRDELDMDISVEKLEERFPGSVITRAHYARYMHEHGYISSIKEAFERYIGDHCPYYIPREKVTPEKAVSLIKTAGGVPVLAHPMLYHFGKERLETLVALLKNTGLEALEGIYSTYDAGETRQMQELAMRHGLAISGGSDFHGVVKPGLELGTGYGNLYVPGDILLKLKERR